ncbi:MAG: cardiolipin synthase [Phycisphaerales bacterium]|nr:cardiolipin synthase [Phycisphaerales bacterium]
MDPTELISLSSIIAVLISLSHWVIVIGLGLRIILKRRSTGVSLAWLLIVGLVPFVGAVLYLFVGELWLPRRRIHAYEIFKESISADLTRINENWDITSDQLPQLAKSLNAQSSSLLNISAIGGNSVVLYDKSDCCIDAIIADIDSASISIHMLFYIWESSGHVEQVEAALIRAINRGVSCKLMVDSAGSKHFLRSKRVKELRAAGIEIVEALPASILRVLFYRIDIRNHRKIISIDQEIAYTGSMNMVDPEYFGVGKGVGEWIDVMVRVRGPAACVLDLVAKLDWAMEFSDNAGRDAKSEIRSVHQFENLVSHGEVPTQIVPSGPDQAPRIAHDMLLTLIYNTEKRLIITTPYFIPSEAMLTAMTAAALRGVQVTLVVPEKVDSILVRLASKSYFEDLLETGVQICTYRGGLLHAKTVTADDTVALVGTVNMDKRSFWINFEISLFAYDKSVVNALRGVQESYINDSSIVLYDDWVRRSVGMRVCQNTAQLMAPIL